MEDKYFRKARYLLETFNESRMKRREVQEEIRKGIRFTRDDAIYMIAGVKAMRYDGDHVQSSSTTDRMADGVLKIDEVLERMNREASKELTEEYDRLSANVALVNVGLTEMDPDCRRVIKQRYVDGVPVDELKAHDGRQYHYRTGVGLIHRGTEQFAQFLRETEGIRKEAEAANQDNDMEGWYE